MKKNYNDAKNVCTNNTELCSSQDLCPNNQPIDKLKDTFGSNDNWIAVSDSDNEWLTYVKSDRLCKTHTQVAGGKPGWGTDNETGNWIRAAKCCPIKSTPTTTPQRARPDTENTVLSTG